MSMTVPPVRQPLRLPAGSVRALLALLIAGLFWLLLLLPAEKQIPIPLFLYFLAGMVLLFVTLWKYEMTSKHAAMQLRALRRKLAGDDEPLRAAGRTAAPAATLQARPDPH